MVFELDSPSWSVDGRDWPNRAHSRFVSAGRLSFHVQEMGRPAETPGAAGTEREGEAGGGQSVGVPARLLLLHGTGASTHSFRDLAPKLAEEFHVLAPDLPGHGFTGMPRGDGLSLDGMARLVSDLLVHLAFDPDIVVGHSAGAAILVAMTLDGMIRPKAIVALNGALLPIRGAALFSPMAKLLFLNPLAPRLFARRALDRDATRRLLEGTGSRIDGRGIELYVRLFRRSGHVAATLGMMAHWDLHRLERRLPQLDVPLVLVTSAGDRAIPPRDGEAVAARVRSGRIVALGQGGHLLHEERPAEVAALVAEIAGEAGLSRAPR